MIQLKDVPLNWSGHKQRLRESWGTSWPLPTRRRGKQSPTLGSIPTSSQSPGRWWASLNIPYVGVHGSAKGLLTPLTSHSTCMTACVLYSKLITGIWMQGNVATSAPAASAALPRAALQQMGCEEQPSTITSRPRLLWKKALSAALFHYNLPKKCFLGDRAASAAHRCKRPLYSPSLHQNRSLHFHNTKISS